MSYLIKGFDISHWEIVDWNLIKNSDYKFGIAKTSEATWEDMSWKSHNAGMKSINLPDGGFHFYRPKVDPINQANFFYGLAKDTRIRPSIDFEVWYEEDEEYYKSTNRDIIIKNIQSILNTTQSLFNKVPMIYTSYGFWNEFIGKTDWVKNYPLWVANYNVLTPTLPWGWDKFIFWQYTDREIITGIKGQTDLNYFYGSEEDLKIFMGETTIPTPNPVTVPVISKCKVTTGSLKIRSLPSISSSVVGWLYNGDTPYNLGETKVGNDIWIQIGWKQYAAKIYNGNTYMIDL
jgi:GH25 family lysozyme M1 (1,4-beta-N-acetylmuramidase)